MPVTSCNQDQETIYQRDQYAKGGIGRWHWDKRDEVSLRLVRACDRTLVDIGCGEGITLEKMHSQFHDRTVLGVDLLSENIEICKRHGCRVKQGDVYNIPFPSGSVDFVMFMEVIEHLENPDKAIQEIHRILVPGGRLVIVFPNDGFFKIARLLTLHLREAAYDPGHVYQWCPQEMKTFLNGQGFVPVFSRNIPFYLWPLSLHCIMAADKK